MAHIEPRGSKYRVRWRDPDGRSRNRSAPDKKSAQALKRDVERTVARGERWEPRATRQRPDLERILSGFIEECARINRPSTVRRYACNLELFRQWLRHTEGENAFLDPELLSKRLLTNFWDYLLKSGRHGRSRQPSTSQKILSVVERFWAWAYNEDDYEFIVPQPKRLKVLTEPRTPTIAPTWAEMDACIAVCEGPLRQLGILLRFTGLRVQQAMHLRWDDFDLANCRLTIRGELGKSKDERKGRIMPVSKHLVDEMGGWGPREGFLIPSTRKEDGPRAREARARDMGRAWKRAGVREEAWRQRPHHAFRKGFISELKRAGADVDAVEFLVGHSLGLRGVYMDPEALPLREAVGLVPALHSGSSSNLLALQSPNQ